MTLLSFYSMSDKSQSVGIDRECNCVLFKILHPWSKHILHLGKIVPIRELLRDL